MGLKHQEAPQGAIDAGKLKKIRKRASKGLVSHQRQYLECLDNKVRDCRLSVMRGAGADAGAAATHSGCSGALSPPTYPQSCSLATNSSPYLLNLYTVPPFPSPLVLVLVLILVFIL